jgi:hypothetical protein
MVNHCNFMAMFDVRHEREREDDMAIGELLRDVM